MIGGAGSGWLASSFNPAILSIMFGAPTGAASSVLIHVLGWLLPDVLAGSLVARYGAVFLLVFNLTVSRHIFKMRLY